MGSSLFTTENNPARKGFTHNPAGRSIEKREREQYLADLVEEKMKNSNLTKWQGILHALVEVASKPNHKNWQYATTQILNRLLPVPQSTTESPGSVTLIKLPDVNQPTIQVAKVAKAE